MQLDALDRKLLYELDKDASMPIASLARRLKRSKEVVAYRMQRLRGEGVLLSCSAIVDMSALGHFTFRVYIRWQNMTAAEKERFWERMSRDERIWTIAILHGRWDLAFFMGVRSVTFVDEFHKVWSAIQATHKDRIAESKIAIYSPVHNFNKRFFVEGKAEVVERVYGRGRAADIDDLDERILKEYAPDVRAPLTRIAHRLGVSAETVRQRVRRLEQQKVIAGYKADMDVAKLGHQGYRVDFSLNSTRRNKELFEYIKQHRYFYQVNLSIGGADFEAEIVVRDLNHLLEVLEEAMSRFSDVMRGYEYYGYSRFPKLTIVPD